MDIVVGNGFMDRKARFDDVVAEAATGPSGETRVRRAARAVPSSRRAGSRWSPAVQSPTHYLHRGPMQTSEVTLVIPCRESSRTGASQPRPARSPDPGELTHAAVMAALCAATAIIAAPMPSAACGT
jgi:hypothetical protein